jgi:DNA-binding HxlR family transcriptional regulator
MLLTRWSPKVTRHIRCRSGRQGGTFLKPCAPELSAEACRTLAQTLARVGDKWSMMTIVSLEDDEMRFNALRRRISGISQKMLTATLRGLERDGYVARRVTPTKPASVFYSLTPLGREALEPVRALAAWTLSRMGTIQAARVAYDARAKD